MRLAKHYTKGMEKGGSQSTFLLNLQSRKSAVQQNFLQRWKLCLCCPNTVTEFSVKTIRCKLQLLFWTGRAYKD